MFETKAAMCLLWMVKTPLVFPATVTGYQHGPSRNTIQSVNNLTACVCVCVHVRVRVREREKGREREDYTDKLSRGGFSQLSHQKSRHGLIPFLEKHGCTTNAVCTITKATPFEPLLDIWPKPSQGDSKQTVISERDKSQDLRLKKV